MPYSKIVEALRSLVTAITSSLLEELESPVNETKCTLFRSHCMHYLYSLELKLRFNRWGINRYQRVTLGGYVIPSRGHAKLSESSISYTK